MSSSHGGSQNVVLAITSCKRTFSCGLLEEIAFPTLGAAYAKDTSRRVVCFAVAYHHHGGDNFFGCVVVGLLLLHPV